MLFSVIYTADCQHQESIVRFRPPQARTLWEQTEGDEEYDYAYLEGDWEKGKHRKWCGLLTKKQFERFLDATGLFAEPVETLGSIGAPGLGLGRSPAISFRQDHEPHAILGAYVTPIPEVRKQRFDERDWQRVRRAVRNVIGNN